MGYEAALEGIYGGEYRLEDGRVTDLSYCQGLSQYSNDIIEPANMVVPSNRTAKDGRERRVEEPNSSAREAVLEQSQYWLNFLFWRRPGKKKEKKGALGLL